MYHDGTHVNAFAEHYLTLQVRVVLKYARTGLNTDSPPLSPPPLALLATEPCGGWRGGGRGPSQIREFVHPVRYLIIVVANLFFLAGQALLWSQIC